MKKINVLVFSLGAQMNMTHDLRKKVILMGSEVGEFIVP